MLPAKLLLNVFVISFFEIVGQMFIKTYYEQENRQIYFFLLGWLAYLGVVYFLFRAYSTGNFAIVNSSWNAVTTFTIAVIGWFYYKEHLTKIEIIGVGLVILGFLVIGAFSEGGQRDAASIKQD